MLSWSKYLTHGVSCIFIFILILDVVPYIVNTPKTKHEAVETCGGKSKVPGRWLVAFLARQGGLPPPLYPPALLAHVEHRKNGRVELRGAGSGR